MELPAPEHHHKRKTDWKFVTVLVLLAAILIANIVPLFTPELPKAQVSQFDLLHPEIARLDVDEFLEIQKEQTVSLTPLREKLKPIIADERGTYGIYVEDLFTGAWMGINEREPFIPASLMKVPLMVAVLKDVELGKLSLDQTIKVDLANTSENGETRTVNELLRITSRESNNIAANTLGTLISPDDINAAFVSFGIPVAETVTGKIDVSPKEYGNILRSLYFSAYLRRRFSQLLLSMLVDTEYNEQLVPGIPVEVKVAHKVGFWKDDGQHHDCGIVYLPEKNYLICVMTKNTEFIDASRVTTEISRTVFAHMASSRK